MIGPKWVIDYNSKLLNHPSLAQRAHDLSPLLYTIIFKLGQKGWPID